MVVTGATADGLRNGRLCTFIRNDGRPFTGRVTRLIEHQRTRLLLQVTHVNSLARFSLVVPYELYYSPKKARFLRWIAWWIWSDSEGQVKGTSLNAVDFWEICDDVQMEYKVGEV